jgi:hypothetical protein
VDALSQLLAGLGPWGVAIGIALTVGGQWVRNRMQPTAPAPPVTPAPAAGPAAPVVVTPAPAAPASPSPVLDAILAIIRLRLQTAAAGADIDHETAGDVLKAFAPKK